MHIIPVILSGGNGTRLWPLSRELSPKQFLPLLDSNETLLQSTLTRLDGLNITHPLVICNSEHRFIVAEQLREIAKSAKIILEPMGKNTAPAIAIAALLAMQHNQDAILLVLPADHSIANKPRFHEAIKKAADFAEQDFLATFGITVDRPETGYGYIKAGESLGEGAAYKVEHFIEKPNLETAKQFLEAGDHYWNSGMFMFKASQYLTELEKFAPDILTISKQAVCETVKDDDFIRLDKEVFAKCRADSIDYAVMERTTKSVVIPLDADWSDVGSWSSLWEVKHQDGNGNVLHGDVITHEVTNSYLHSEDRMLVAVGLEECIVVETADAVLVANKNKAQDVKEIVNHLKHHTRDEAINHKRVVRPWGSYETLVEGTIYKVKRIIVNPGASLSLQLHHHRSEHWIVVKGVAEVTCGERVFTLQHDQSTYIPAETKHRLYNPGTIALELIEVQTGEYLGEDDIVRFQDIYGRVG